MHSAMANAPQTDDDWRIHAINIHGMFFERWCQHVVTKAAGWRLDSTNYPVEFPPPNGPFRGKEGSLDIRASKVIGDRVVSLIIECKKNNPEFIDWLFFKQPSRRGPQLSFYQIEKRVEGAGGESWTIAPSIQTVQSPFDVADEGRETRGDYSAQKELTKTKTSNVAIQDAARQVSLARQAIVTEDHGIFKRPGTKVPWTIRHYFPVIVTTARLFMCDFDPQQVAPDTGVIPLDKVSMTECSRLVYEYPLPRPLQSTPADETYGYNEGRLDAFTRLHIFVVQSEHFPMFLDTFPDKVGL